jgi:predicted nucleotidyltransferase component of viral defense system
MTRILEILDRFLDGVRKDNPFHLVLKGGTALSVHHLPGHRESEDLDFDAPGELRPRNSEVVLYVRGIFDKMRTDGAITGYDIPKAVFASTERFHMKVVLLTHVKYDTKIDLTYRPMPDHFEMEGQLRFYSSERMLVDKLLTFASRGELKDFYDISLLLEKVNATAFNEPAKVAGLVQKDIEKGSTKEIVADFRAQMRATDLRFHFLKESGIDSFIVKTIRNLRRFKNELMRRG